MCKNTLASLCSTAPLIDSVSSGLDGIHPYSRVWCTWIQTTSNTATATWPTHFEHQQHLHRRDGAPNIDRAQTADMQFPRTMASVLAASRNKLKRSSLYCDYLRNQTSIKAQAYRWDCLTKCHNSNDHDNLRGNHGNERYTGYPISYFDEVKLEALAH